MNPLEAMALQGKQNKELYLPKKIELAINLINAFIKNNNILGLKIAILLSGARQQITYDNENKVHFNADELCSLLKIDRKTLSRNLKNICSTFYTYVNEEGFVGGTTPIHSYEYYSKNKMIWFEISSQARKLFTELGRGGYQFTNDCLSENLMGLKHKHSLRMQLFLEMINKYSKNASKRKMMSMEEVNGYFGTNYSRWIDIERKILIPVRDEITKSNKLTFDYDFKSESVGTGRPKFTNVIINLIDNEKQKQINEELRMRKYLEEKKAIYREHEQQGQLGIV